jgi:hypothetical protein
MNVIPFEYQFEREKIAWDPEFSEEKLIVPYNNREPSNRIMLTEARGDNRAMDGWMLVKGLVSREGPIWEKDQAALSLAAPESGSFILVSLRRRKKERFGHSEKEY